MGFDGQISWDRTVNFSGIRRSNCLGSDGQIRWDRSLICFVSLIVEKYLELTTKLSLREIRFLLWNITETHIQDRLTKEIFVFQSPTNAIMESPLAVLIKNWKLLPH